MSSIYYGGNGGGYVARFVILKKLPEGHFMFQAKLLMPAVAAGLVILVKACASLGNFVAGVRR